MKYICYENINKLKKQKQQKTYQQLHTRVHTQTSKLPTKKSQGKIEIYASQ